MAKKFKPTLPQEVIEICVLGRLTTPQRKWREIQEDLTRRGLTQPNGEPYTTVALSWNAVRSEKGKKYGIQKHFPVFKKKRKKRSSKKSNSVKVSNRSNLPVLPTVTGVTAGTLIDVLKGQSVSDEVALNIVRNLYK